MTMRGERMDILQAIKERHSVRTYLDKEVEDFKVSQLKQLADECNLQSGLNIQIVTNNPDAFDNFLAHYGKIEGAQNYIALVGDKGKDLHEKVGYFGQKLVLLAQQLGLNTCWLALTYCKRKSNVQIADGQKLACIISFGYGANQGTQHKNKPLDKVCKMDKDTPQWFKDGMDCVMCAPTAVNQQKFWFEQKNGIVTAKAKKGFYSKIDLGIVKLHFEIGAGTHNFEWAR